MKPNTIVTTYAITITLVIILMIAWRAGYHAGVDETLDRTERVLNEQISMPRLGGTFDAICDEFADEWR